jgi:dCMP deaminase
MFYLLNNIFYLDTAMDCNEITNAIANSSLNCNSSKRLDYISWDEEFMSIAIIAAQRSKDPVTQVGCVIVDSETKRVISIGYNGFPIGINDNEFPWNRKNSNSPEDLLNSKGAFVLHAETNALVNKNKGNVKGAILYCTLFPCNECAKQIIQYGIKEIVYLETRTDPKDWEWEASRRMLNSVKIPYRCYNGRKLKFNFE